MFKTHIHISLVCIIFLFTTADGAGQSLTQQKAPYLSLQMHPLSFVHIPLSQFLKYPPAYGQNPILMKEINTQESCELKSS